MSGEVTFVRIYLREGEHVMRELVKHLQVTHEIAGLTVFQGTAGIGSDGKLRTASLVDLSLDLPLVVEFFDTPERVEAALADVVEKYQLRHVVTWPAKVHGATNPNEGE
ncbi:DUF190 domain-containing protein [Methylococcus sp. ANG]|uniref:DUF190 domain-containing protein n=1 Tax=unclassified Methylococcus TaxID=2618889 RepID=UPI001C52D375|nr:DUF190 domain-containing protein [Methylococcus sp. Mc7]QXP84242.1 DUF190 domain-containing protein [Methylococcus sp. Mc7]